MRFQIRDANAGLCFIEAATAEEALSIFLDNTLRGMAKVLDGPEVGLAVGDVLHHLIAVPLAIGELHLDVDRVPRQRQKRLRRRLLNLNTRQDLVNLRPDFACFQFTSIPSWKVVDIHERS